MWYALQVTEPNGESFIYPVDPKDAIDLNAVMKIGQQVNMQNPGVEVLVRECQPNGSTPFAVFPVVY